MSDPQTERLASIVPQTMKSGGNRSDEEEKSEPCMETRPGNIDNFRHDSEQDSCRVPVSSLSDAMCWLSCRAGNNNDAKHLYKKWFRFRELGASWISVTLTPEKKMIFSLGLFFVKKTPKFLCAVVTIINVIMIFFVINGATHDSDAYANLYSVEFTFNETSDISSALSAQYSKQHKGNNLQDFIVRVGYMGVCINFGDGMQCGYTSDMEYTYKDQVPSFSVTGGNKNSSSSTSLEVFDIAYAIQQKTARYQIFIVEIIFLLALLVVQLYNMIGFLPLQKYASYLSMVILGMFWIILCISITWTMVVCHDLVSVGGVMTMNILSFSKGKRSQGVIWAVFALTIVQSAYYMWTLVGGIGLMHRFTGSGPKKNTDVEKDAGSISDSVMSSITTLRGTL